MTGKVADRPNDPHRATHVEHPMRPLTAAAAAQLAGNDPRNESARKAELRRILTLTHTLTPGGLHTIFLEAANKVTQAEETVRKCEERLAELEERAKELEDTGSTESEEAAQEA